MATFSKKMMGKEAGSAEVYAKPHTMTGEKVELGNGYSGAKPTRADSVNMSVGNINRDGYNPDVKELCGRYILCFQFNLPKPTR